MKKKIIDFVKSIFAEEYVSLSQEQRNGYSNHFELEVFKQNPMFQEFAKNIQEIKASGQFKTHLGKEEVVAKTGEVKLKNGFKRHITSFVFGETNQVANRYVEVREESRISGIGNVWDIENEGKLVFLFENQNVYNLGFDVVTVIDNPNVQYWNASFFNTNGRFLGMILGQQTEENNEKTYKYDASLNSMLLGSDKDIMLKVSAIKTKFQLDFPLSSMQKLYSKCPQAFTVLPEELINEKSEDLEK
ncbi:MAG: hypothetical protein J6K71_01840 [Clostridia bacterium]|nr:hypothetical protein [Clostridia bacterium]